MNYSMVEQRIGGLAILTALLIFCNPAAGEEKKPSPPPTTRPTTAPSTRPAARPPQPDRRVEVAKFDLAALTVALDAYEIDNAMFPTTEQGLKALVEKPANLDSWHGPYVKGLAKDPWDHPFVYKCPGVHNPTSFDLSSLGPDGREGNDDIDNWTPRR